jgi:tape measure domain-containing protein
MIVRDLITRLGFTVDDKGVKSFEQKLQKVKRSSLILGGGIIAMGTKFLKAAGDMEQTEIAFETMTGSAEKAQKLIEDLTTFAAKTPFEMKGLIENSKKLLAFGFQSDEIVEKMTVLGNISAGVGRDKLPTLVAAFGKIRVKGKASMEELNMLLEAGVPILDQLAKNTNVTTEQLFKMVSKGLIKFDDVSKALTDLQVGSGKFTDLMIKQSKSFLGLISNVGDFLQVFAISIGKELLPQAKEFVKLLIVWLDANREMIKQNIVGFFKGLFKVLRFILKIMRTLVRFTGSFKNLVKIVVILGAAFKTASIAAAAFNVTAAFIPTLIAGVIALIALMAEDLYQFFTGGESLTKDFVDMFKLAWQSLADFVSAIWDNMLKSIEEAMRSSIAAITTAIAKVKRFFGFAKKVTGAGQGFAKVERLVSGVNRENTKGLSGRGPGSIARAGAVTNSKTVKVNSTVNLGVAPGTPAAQKKEISDFAEKKFGDVFRQQLNILDINNPVVER